MGTVYEAIDQRFECRVAVKEARFTEEGLRKQFEREARLLYTLRHPAITRVIDHFSEEHGQFLVMDYVEGEDLGAALRSRAGGFSIGQVLDWGDQLLDALHYLHSHDPQIIHRDIKPQNLNLKISKMGRVILLDFGLAKTYALPAQDISSSVFGYTPNYAPLEQIQGTGTDSRSDLYSLGATLYHLMTGTVPVDVLARLTATTDRRPDPLLNVNELNSEIPVEVASVLRKALAIGRSDRSRTAVEFRKALREADPRRKPPMLARDVPPAARQPQQREEQVTIRAIPFFHSVGTLEQTSFFSAHIRTILLTVGVLSILGVTLSAVGLYYKYKPDLILSRNNSNMVVNQSPPLADSSRASGPGPNISAGGKIESIHMARDNGYGNPGDYTDAFRVSDRTIHCVAKLAETKAGTKMKFSWFIVDADGSQNEKIKDIDYTTRALENIVHGHLTLPQDWPSGKYRVLR